MSVFSDFFSFIGSYPMWAKGVVGACVAVGVFTLIVAPRSEGPSPGRDPEEGGEPAAPAGRWVLTIDRVELFRTANLPGFEMDAGTELQLRIDVNGALFDYPDLDGVEWVRTGPRMASQRIVLPKSDDGYDIRIEGTVREGGNEARLVSLSRIPFQGSPAEGEYSLYPVDMQTRAPVPAASVVWELAQQAG